MATSTAPVGLPVIKAAGGIVQRSRPRGEEVMVVYRKRHQDWTLPKGKLKDGESFQEAALREVEEETGCSCNLGNYLGTISYAQNGVPKVVMFWRMTVIEEKPMAETEEIGEALWMQIPAAIQRLTHAQERSLLARVAGARPAPAREAAETEAEAEPVALQSPQLPRPPKKSSLEDQNTQSRLLRESQAFRVELKFLERRSQQPDKSWAAAANDQLDNVTRCLESNDVGGGMLCLYAARRYAVFGLNPAELATRARVLREEARKLSSWRAQAAENLLTLPDDQLTAERVAEAMALRDEDATNQYYQTRLAGDQLGVLLAICGLGAMVLLLFTAFAGQAGMVAPSLLFGLFGSAFCAAHALLRDNSDSRQTNFVVMLTPVLFGAIAGLAGCTIYQYAALAFSLGPRHTGLLLALAFLCGCAGQILLVRFAGPNDEAPVMSKRH